MNERRRLQIEQFQADQTVVREAAGVVRAAPDAESWAGLDEPDVARLLASVLDEAADRLAGFDPQLRRHIVRVSRELVGRPMDRPGVRRNRRR